LRLTSAPGLQRSEDALANSMKEYVAFANNYSDFRNYESVGSNALLDFLLFAATFDLSHL